MENNDLADAYQAVIDSPIPYVEGIGLRVKGGQLTSIDFLSQVYSRYVETEARPVVDVLDEYFANNRVPRELSLAPKGTQFQQRVWLALRAIPFGQVRRYGELAEELGTSARAVANACRANPLPLLVPCHRVVASNGLGGYMGETEGEALAIKLWLLQHEGYV